MTGLVESPGRAAGAGVGAPSDGGLPGRVPDFFIVGNPKSGTTALYEMLRGHPQIYMPELKEPHFLAGAPGPVAPAGRDDGPSTDPLPRTLDAYLALFEQARPEQRVGEASASYLRSPRAAARIAELAPGARIVAILREPTEFLRSLHLQHLQDHVERERDFRVALRHEQVVRDGDTVRRYSDRVRYVEHLRRYDELFGERVLVLIYDDFQRENEATVRRVLRFLGIDDGVPVVPVRANPTVRMRSVRLAKLVHAVRTGQGPLGRSLNVPLEAFTSRRMRRAALRLVRRRVLYGEPDAPDERLMGELRARFKGEVVALSEYLGRDLVSLWGYDRLG